MSTFVYMAKTFQAIFKMEQPCREDNKMSSEKNSFCLQQKEIFYKTCWAKNSQIAHQGGEAIFLLKKAFTSLLSLTSTVSLIPVCQWDLEQKIEAKALEYRNIVGLKKKTPTILIIIKQLYTFL